MLEISEAEVIERMRFDNPWWSGSATPELNRLAELPRRSYFAPFIDLVSDRTVNRAVVLMGPRRVGKTIMAQQTLVELLNRGAPNNHLLYISIETPIYTGIALEKLLRLFLTLFEHTSEALLTVVFDEIQYLRNWEIHLKSLVDSYPQFRFIATGSAAAALRLKSNESGAGRFTEFLLPPLTFEEYLRLSEIELPFESYKLGESSFWKTSKIDALNEHFVDYINFGGYPEAVVSPQIRENSARFIKSDIIDKVLLRDLPSLYGIQDIQELNRLFTTLAYNTGNEVTLDGLSQSSGVAKNTIKRYLDYLEAAFLIQRVSRVDQNARTFKRATAFKVYLTNPTMRAALFGPLNADQAAMGHMAETAIFSQWFHDKAVLEVLRYARWNTGEIDIVACDRQQQRANWLVEIKWSDAPPTDFGSLRHVVMFAKRNGLQDPLVTTKSIRAIKEINGVRIRFAPCSEYAYSLSRNIRENSIR